MRPGFKKQPGFFMSENEIINQSADNVDTNADTQESVSGAEQATETTTATTNVPEEATPVAEVVTEQETVPVAEQETVPEAEQEAVLVAEQETATVAEATTEQETTAEVVVEKPKYVPKVETPHDDFDWSIDKRNVSTYNQAEREKYDSVYDNTFVQINDGEIINGAVVGLTKTDVVINIGFKSDGLISLNEFRDLTNLNVGDEVEVMW